jgi:N-acetylglucosaminyl-diphospho-decaprenol L-rhamnosyltransferase
MAAEVLPEHPISPTSLTVSVVSHGQMPLANSLIADLIRHPAPQLKRLVVTLNVPEAEAVQAESAAFEVVVLRNNRPRGFGANHNRAFRHCDTEWFAVLNPDLRLGDDALGLLLEARGPLDGLIAPMILNPDGTPADSARRVPTPFSVASRRLRRQSQGPDADFDWLAGMCLVLNSEAFRRLGGFDERYYMYCEDIDLSLRMQLAGWRLRRVARAHVVHDARRDSHRSAQHLHWHLSSLIRLWTSPVFWSYLRRRSELAPLHQTGT